jgi:hypothetical protein
VSVGDHHPEDTQDDGRQHIALRHPAYAARHTNWADSMEGNAVANPCQATEPAEKVPSVDPTVVCSAEADVELTAGKSNFTLRSRDGNLCASGHARRSGLLWCGRSSGCHVVRKYSIRCSSSPDNLPIQNRAHNAGAAPPAPEALPVPIRPANLLEAVCPFLRSNYYDDALSGKGPGMRCDWDPRLQTMRVRYAFNAPRMPQDRLEVKSIPRRLDPEPHSMKMLCRERTRGLWPVESRRGTRLGAMPWGATGYGNEGKDLRGLHRGVRPASVRLDPFRSLR